MLMGLKLREYASATDDAPTASEHGAWVDDPLGFDDFARPDAAQTLQTEVNAYLLDSQCATSSLMYWQVGWTCSYFLLVILLIN